MRDFPYWLYAGGMTQLFKNLRWAEKNLGVCATGVYNDAEKGGTMVPLMSLRWAYVGHGYFHFKTETDMIVFKLAVS